jgi:hypothetical protein
METGKERMGLMIDALGVGDPCLWDWGDLGGQAADVINRDAVSETWRA